MSRVLTRLSAAVRMLLLCAIPLAPAAHGQTIFRQVNADGQVIYTDKKIPGMRIESEVRPDRAPTVGSSNLIAPPAPEAISPGTPGIPGTPIAPGVLPSLPPLPGSPRPQNSAESATRAQAQDELQRMQKMERDRAAAEQLEQAQAKLDAARRLQQEGLVPQPGERTPTVNGFTRLNERYHQRQGELARAVDRAEQDLRLSEAAPSQ